MGYFDLQVNGYGGVDFNAADLSADALHAACAKLADDGVEGVLATIITENLERMCARLRRIVALRENDSFVRQRIAGLHIEGPFINEAAGYLGAHPRDAVMQASIDVMKQLLDAGGGLVKMVTLAPECDAEFRTVDFLAKQNVHISAGHTDASIEQLNAAIDAGLSLFTHLGNGCPMQMHRHDNIIQRVLHLRDKLWITFIADGVHVPFFALKNYIDLVGVDRAIVVTDAIALAGMGPGRYSLGRWDLLIGDDMVARSPDGSHFLGSASTMKQCDANLQSLLGLSREDCDRLLRANPLKAIGDAS